MGVGSLSSLLCFERCVYSIPAGFPFDAVVFCLGVWGDPLYPTSNLDHAAGIVLMVCKEGSRMITHLPAAPQLLSCFLCWLQHLPCAADGVSKQCWHVSSSWAGIYLQPSAASNTVVLYSPSLMTEGVVVYSTSRVLSLPEVPVTSCNNVLQCVL
jgi:hypothetical protein